MALTLSGNNVYRNGVVSKFSDNEGLLDRDNMDFVGKDEDVYHSLVKSDRLDLLAHRYYKNRVEDSSKFWWVIADANNIENPLDLTELIGTDILVPNILDVLLKLQE
jgi:hypothetical protein